MVACHSGDRTNLGKQIISGKTGLFFIARPAKGNIPRDRLPVPLSPGYAVMHASRRCFNLQADDHLNPDFSLNSRLLCAKQTPHCRPGSALKMRSNCRSNAVWTYNRSVRASPRVPRYLNCKACSGG
jgi:hypothetical protein